MATCPNCHSEKPLAAPVCHECNNTTGFFEQLFFSAVNIVTQLATMVVLFYLVKWIFF